jgi:phytoene dehydrogenase-like protein
MLIGGLKSALLYQRYAKLTVSDFTARFFNRDSELFRLFKNLGYPEMAAWILGGAVATIFTDYWTVENGMQSWANVLAENFKKAGGELKLNAPVEQICTRQQTAIGVKSQNQFYEADYVISAADYKKTFLQLLDQPASIPAPLLEKIRQTSVSEGIFTVYLGLKLTYEQMQAVLKIPHVMYFDEKPDADVHNPDDPDFFAKTSVGLYSPSLLNPSLAPAGKSSLMLQVMAPTNWMEQWGAGDRQRYCELKEKVKKTLIQKASAVIPNLHALIEFEDAATPLTYERYTQNTNGATSAWSWSPKNQFHKTFYRSYIETPIQNLLIGSCWATQIGGVPGAIGAALNCLKRIR